MDIVEIKKNIDMYSSELDKYQNLSRQLLTRDEMLLIDRKILQFKAFIRNLKDILKARS